MGLINKTRCGEGDFLRKERFLQSSSLLVFQAFPFGDAVSSPVLLFLRLYQTIDSAAPKVSAISLIGLVCAFQPHDGAFSCTDSS